MYSDKSIEKPRRGEKLKKRENCPTRCKVRESHVPLRRHSVEMIQIQQAAVGLMSQEVIERTMPDCAHTGRRRMAAQQVGTAFDSKRWGRIVAVAWSKG